MTSAKIPNKFGKAPKNELYLKYNTFIVPCGCLEDASEEYLLNVLKYLNANMDYNNEEVKALLQQTGKSLHGLHDFDIKTKFEDLNDVRLQRLAHISCIRFSDQYPIDRIDPIDPINPGVTFSIWSDSSYHITFSGGKRFLSETWHEGVCLVVSIGDSEFQSTSKFNILGRLISYESKINMELHGCVYSDAQIFYYLHGQSVTREKYVDHYNQLESIINSYLLHDISIPLIFDTIRDYLDLYLLDRENQKDTKQNEFVIR